MEDVLWKRYSDDISQRCGNCGIAPQTSSGSPVSKLKESTWSDNRCNSPCVLREFSRRRLPKLKCVKGEDQFQPVRNRDARHIVHLLKACARQKDLGKGSDLHAYIRQNESLRKNCYVASALIHMYASCGALAAAQQVLYELPVPVRSVVVWTALISGYVQQGQGEEALKCFYSMQHEGYYPNSITFTCALKACGSIKAVTQGQQIHDNIVNLGLLGKDKVLGSALVDMYTRCGALTKAQQVLDELPVRDVVAWTALIAGYIQHGQANEALKCFDNMQFEGHHPDSITFICALKACGSTGAVCKGEQIHHKIVSLGIVDKSIVLGNALVDMYAKCGVLGKVQQVFDELPMRDVVTWNALIAGYVQQGQNEEALKWFDYMQHEGHSPDAITFTGALKACWGVGKVTKGEQIHDKIVTLGILEKDIVLASALVYMYARCDAPAKAQQLFNELPVRNVVTWNALIEGYVEQEQGEEAFKCFDSMQREGHSANAITFTCVLKTCGRIGAISKGEHFHDMIMSSGLLENNVVIGSALVDMYANFAALGKAQQVFNNLLVQDMVTWTALLAGYAQLGHGEEAIKHFERMQSKGVRPGSATLVCVFNACSHAGLLDQAEMYFSRMSIKYGIQTDLEHYCCMADAYGRAGKLDKTLLQIEKMCASYPPFWLVILGACHKWGDVKMGSLAFGLAVHLDKTSTAAYSCMTNIYRAANIQEE